MNPKENYILYLLCFLIIFFFLHIKIIIHVYRRTSIQSRFSFEQNVDDL